MEIFTRHITLQVVFVHKTLILTMSSIKQENLMMKVYSKFPQGVMYHSLLNGAEQRSQEKWNWVCGGQIKSKVWHTLNRLTSKSD